MNIEVYSYNMQDEFDQGGFLPDDLKNVPQVRIGSFLSYKITSLFLNKGICRFFCKELND